MFQWQPLVLVSAIGAVLCLGSAWLLWRRRHLSRAATPLTGVMLGLAQWSTAEVISASLTSVHLQVAFYLAVFPGVATVVYGFYWVCQLVISSDASVARRTLLLLAIEPVLGTVVAATNFWHHKLFTSASLSGRPALLITAKGPLFWAHVGYSYAVLAWCMFSVLRASRTASQTHRRQLRTVLIASLLPTATNVAYEILFNGNAAIDFSALGFIATGVILVRAIFDNSLLRTSVARDVVFQRVSDAVIVVDPDGVLIDFNLAAEVLGLQLRPGVPQQLAGREIGELLPEADVASLMRPGSGDREGRIASHGRTLDVRSSELTNRAGGCIGFAMVLRDVTEMNAANAELLEQLAVNQRLSAELAEQAVRDVLTGLYNRRHLMNMLEANLADAIEHGASFGVILFDVDLFKSVNDRFGHAVGDEVLSAVATALAAGSRDDDTVARYGGEEFVILMPGANSETALRRAEQLRLSCAGLRIQSAEGLVLTTVSAGVATYPQLGATAAGLLQAADLALYRAKDSGRNRVMLADEFMTTNVAN